MRCSRCGEICKDNQAFCLKCGNPIQVVPDFNLIEAELANNIGEFLDEIDSEESKEVEIEIDNDDMRTKKIDKELSDELKLVNISKERIVVSNNHIEREEIKITENFEDDFDRETGIGQRKNNKKRIAIMASIAAAVTIFIIVGSIFLINLLSEKTEYNKATFDSSYAQAQEFLASNDYENAIKHFKIALEKAVNAEQKINARNALDDIYKNDSNKEAERVKNLIELTKLCPSDVKYFETLAAYYTSKQMYSELSAFLVSIENEDVFNKLSIYTTKGPIADKEQGVHSEYIDINLSAEEGTKIYYFIKKITTLDDKVKYDAPTSEDKLYEGPIKIESEGNYLIVAVAINELGISSKPVEFRYAISLTLPDAPVITPSSGFFDKHTKIEIFAPEGSTIYYAYDDEELNTDSKVYTGPLDMIIGVHVIKAFVVDEYGLESPAASESFTFNIKQNYSTVEAKKAIIEKYITQGIILSKDCDLPDGGSIFVSYEKTQTLSNDGFYIYSITYNDADYKPTKIEYVAFDYNNGNIIKLISENNEFVLLYNRDEARLHIILKLIEDGVLLSNKCDTENGYVVIEYMDSATLYTSGLYIYKMEFYIKNPEPSTEEGAKDEMILEKIEYMAFDYDDAYILRAGYIDDVFDLIDLPPDVVVEEETTDGETVEGETVDGETVDGETGEDATNGSEETTLENNASQTEDGTEVPETTL